MTMNEFAGMVQDRIREYLDPEFAGCEIRTEDVIKSGDMHLKGLIIRNPEEAAAPRIFLEEYYDAYVNGHDLDDILNELADRRASFGSLKWMDEKLNKLLSDTEEVKKHITYTVMNRDANEQYLSTHPYTPVEDLALVYHIEIDTTMRTHVTYDNMEKLGLTTEELFTLAQQNTPEWHPATVEGISESLWGIEDDSTGMIVVSNRSCDEGAAAIFYPGMDEILREKIGGDYYVLPSSVHEVIAISKSGPVPLEGLRSLVQGVNREMVTDPRDFLSNEVYERKGSALAVVRDEPKLQRDPVSRQNKSLG